MIGEYIVYALQCPEMLEWHVNNRPRVAALLVITEQMLLIINIDTLQSALLAETQRKPVINMTRVIEMQCELLFETWPVIEFVFVFVLFLHRGDEP